MVSSASSHVICSNLPSPFSPVRFMGYSRRVGEYTVCMAALPLAHSVREPRP